MARDGGLDLRHHLAEVVPVHSALEVRDAQLDGLAEHKPLVLHGHMRHVHKCLDLRADLVCLLLQLLRDEQTRADGRAGDFKALWPGAYECSMRGTTQALSDLCSLRRRAPSWWRHSKLDIW